MSNPTPESPSHSCLLIYDGQCRLCVTAKKGIERLGTDQALDQIRMITYQSEEAKAALGAAYLPGRPDAAYLVGSHGEVVQGLDAFLPLLPGLRGGWFLASLLRLPGARGLGTCLYRIIARHRYRFFGKESQPTQPAKSR
ncbi:MAG TPA: DUF393 domain-containing protein [Nitrospira sp.]